MDSIAQRFRNVEEICRGLADIGWRQDQQRKRELVAGRVRLAKSFHELEKAVRENNDGHIDPALVKEFRQRFERARHGLAIHQSTWIAVRLDTESSGYRASCLQLGEVLGDFFNWGRRTFATNGQRPLAISPIAQNSVPPPRPHDGRR